MSSPATNFDADQRTSRTPWQEFWRHFKRNRPAVIGSVIVIALTLMAFSGWFLTTDFHPFYVDPNQSDLKVSLTPPLTEVEGKTFIFGTDENGRSVWTRLLAGSITSLSVGFVVVGISVILGILVGGIAGFYGRGKARFPFLVTILAPPLGFLVQTFDFLNGTEHVLAALCFVAAGAALVLQVVVAVMGRAWNALAWFAGCTVLVVLVFGYPVLRQSQGVFGESYQLHSAALDHKTQMTKGLVEYVAITRELEERPPGADVSDLMPRAAAAQLRYEQEQGDYLVLAAKAALSDVRASIQLKRDANGLEPASDEQLLVGTGVEESDQISFSRAIQKLKDAEEAQAKAQTLTLNTVKVLPNMEVRALKQLAQQRGAHGTAQKNAVRNLEKADLLYRFLRKMPVIVIAGLAFILSFLLLTKAAQEESANRRALRPIFFPTMTIDNAVMRVIEIMGTVPRLFLLLTILAFYERSAMLVMFVLGVTSWMGTARFVRAEMLSLRERDFVSAARALGMSDFRVVVRHMVPNSLSPVLVSATIGVAQAIIFESTLSFMGIGVGPDEVTWGKMLNEGRQFITSAPWLTMVPGLAIFVVVLAFNLLGEGLREAMNPKLRKR